METRITEMGFNGDLKSIVNQVLIMMAADGDDDITYDIAPIENIVIA